MFSKFFITQLGLLVLLCLSNKALSQRIEGVKDSLPKYGFNDKAGGFIDVNGVKIYYEIYGEGQPLLVLHGNGGSIENAGIFYPELSKKFKVIAIDSRGQGRSGDADTALTYELMAADINAVMEKLQVDSAFIWGHSDGAILGLILAMDYPKRVKKLLAYGANLQPDSSAIGPWAVRGMERDFRKSTDAKEKKLVSLMLDHPNIPFSKLSQIKIPVLVMAGDRDIIRAEHTLQIFQHIPNSQLSIIPGATHSAAWEKKGLFLIMLNDFFSRNFSMPDSRAWFTE